MNTHDLDTACGYCEAHGQREIPGGQWISGPACPDCGGTGYLVTSPAAERLLAFIERHLGHLLRLEIAALRAELSSQSRPRSRRAVHVLRRRGP
jgi:hypothetical protein